MVRWKTRGILSALLALAALSLAGLPSAAITARPPLHDPPTGPHAREEARHVHDLLHVTPAQSRPQPLATRPKGAALLPGAIPVAAVSAATPSVSRDVLGFAPYWELSLNAGWRYDLLTTVAYFGLDVRGDGSFDTTTPGWAGWTSQDLVNTINRAHQAGDRVLLVIKQFDEATINQIVTSAAATQAAVTNTINAIAAMQLDGVNVDFEGRSDPSYPNIQSGMTNFMSVLSQQVHARWSAAVVSIDTYTGSASWDGGIFKIGDLAPAVDAFFVMAYDMAFSNMPASVSGPNAPLSGNFTYNDTTAVAQYLTKASASKVILGVPYYGYKYSTANAQLYANYSGSATANTYAGIQDDFACALQLTQSWDGGSQTPWASWWSPASGDPCGGNHNSWRELYYDNPQSLGLKYDLVNSNNLRGAGIWALGYDGTFPDLWDVLASKFGHPVISSVAPSSGAFSGGQTVTISGQNFLSGVTVTFGGNAAPSISRVSSTQLSVTTPPGLGTVDVIVTNPNGFSTRAAGAYTYNPVPNVLYFTWFDRISSPGFQGDNIHVVNPGASPVTVVVNIPGSPGCLPSGVIQPGSEKFFTCPTGFGGPVTVNSDQPVLASQRVQYFQSFNEVLAQAPSAAQTTQYFTWFDRISSPGFLGDNVHVVNPFGGSTAHVTVSIPGCADQTGAMLPGNEQYFTCAGGFGGPVKVTSDQPVLASQRVQYFQSFNEVVAQSPSAAQTTLDFTWFDRISSPGFQGDNVHVINPGSLAASVTVAIPGQPGCSPSGTIPGGGESYFTCPTGFGGPVKVTSDQPVLVSQRVQYFQSFNEVLGLTP